MEVENISTSMACPRPPKRTESLILSQVRSARAGETSVMENRLYEAEQAVQLYLCQWYVPIFVGCRFSEQAE